MAIDVKTIDETTMLHFKDDDAKQQWISLIANDYFEKPDVRAAMDFTRRWAKVMQHYLIANKAIKLSDIVISAARIANIDCINKLQCKMAIKMIIEIWQFGDELKVLINKETEDIILSTII